MNTCPVTALRETEVSSWIKTHWSFWFQLWDVKAFNVLAAHCAGQMGVSRGLVREHKIKQGCKRRCCFPVLCFPFSSCSDDTGCAVLPTTQKKKTCPGESGAICSRAWSSWDWFSWWNGMLSWAAQPDLVLLQCLRLKAGRNIGNSLPFLAARLVQDVSRCVISAADRLRSALCVSQRERKKKEYDQTWHQCSFPRESGEKKTINQLFKSSR